MVQWGIKTHVTQHTTNLQQMTLKTSKKNSPNACIIIENIVVKGEIDYPFCQNNYKSRLLQMRQNESVYGKVLIKILTYFIKSIFQSAIRITFTPYPYTDTFWCICSRRLWKGEIGRAISANFPQSCQY